MSRQTTAENSVRAVQSWEAWRFVPDTRQRRQEKLGRRQSKTAWETTYYMKSIYNVAFPNVLTPVFNIAQLETIKDIVCSCSRETTARMRLLNRTKPNIAKM